MKILRSTGFLFLIVLLVVGYAYFFEYKGNQKKQEKEEKEKVIFTEAVEEIQEFTIKNPDGEFVFKKIDKDWQMIKPVEDIASTSAVLGFLNQLAAEKYIEVVASGSDINEDIYGFLPKDGKDRPTELVLKYPQKTESIEVGTVAALSGRRYLRINHNPKIYLVNYTWEFSLRKDMNELREKLLIPASFDAKSISLKNPMGTLDFLAGDNNKWVLKNITTNDPDQTAIDDLRYQLLATRALKIEKEQKNNDSIKKYGLNKPVLEILLQDRENNEMKILVTRDKDKKIYAVTSQRNSIFELPANTIEIFSKEADDFRDRKRSLKFEPSQVNSIEYKSDFYDFNIQKKVSLENKSEPEWEGINLKSNQEVNVNKVQELLNKLVELKVGRFFERDIDYQRSGTQILVLKDNQGQELLKLSWSPKPYRDVFVTKSSLSENLFGLATKDIDALPLREIIQTKKEVKK